MIRNLLILVLLSSFSLNSPAKQTLIAAASSTQFALREIKQVFERETGLKVTLSFSSSGNLSRQILQGGPYQLFLSADQSYVEGLKQKHLTLDEGVIYAKGRLVFFTAKPLIYSNDFNEVTSALQTGKLNKLAIANPDHAPYGKAAYQVLENLHLLPSINERLVLGENVAQAAQFSISGAVQGGLISYSLALTPQLQSAGNYLLIPEHLHQPLKAKMVLLNNADATAKAFFQFLQSQTAQAIFERNGFVRDSRTE